MIVYSNLTGKSGVTEVTIFGSNRGSDNSSKLASPPPTMVYGGSIAAFPLTTIPLDPFTTSRVNRRSILAAAYIQSEENVSRHRAEDENKVGGWETMERSCKATLPSDSEEDVMMMVELREKESYMMPIKQAKECNIGKGGRRPVTPE